MIGAYDVFLHLSASKFSSFFYTISEGSQAYRRVVVI